MSNQNIHSYHVIQHSAGFHVDQSRTKMVFKSAYQRSFRQPKWDDFTMEEFQRKLQYRADRRSVEHQHQAWLWDSDDEEDVDEIPMQQQDEKVNRQGTQKETQPNNNERQHTVQAWVDEQQDICSDKRKAEKIEPAVKDPVQHDRQKRKDAHDRDEAEHVSETKHRESHRRHKHRSDDRKKRTKKREKVPESPSIAQNLEERKKQPPFLAYGWANDAPTELRKTHNVLASDPEVYPAALRAARRRQNVIQQKVKIHEEAIKKKELTAPIAEDSHVVFPNEMWLTEYQRNFCKVDDLKRHYGR